MIVKELIELLQKMPQELEAVLYAPYYGQCDIVCAGIIKGDEHDGDVVMVTPYPCSENNFKE